jgi:hypothetical protein
MKLVNLIALICLFTAPSVSKAASPAEIIGGPSFAEEIANIVVRAQDVAVAKEAANAEFEKARHQFFEDCVNGIRGGTAEKNFAELLFTKDIYFLSLYTYEGMTPKAIRQLEGIDTLTGGELDGGLPPTELFGVWVNAVRTALNAPPAGEPWLPTPAAFVDGIAKTADVYEKYKVSRDRAEFGRWRKSLRIDVPAATTPEQLADYYVRYILNTAIKTAMNEIPEGERAATLMKIDAWRTQLHRAILDFENVEVTPEKITEELRMQNFDEALIRSFIDTVDRARQSDEKDLSGVILPTQQELEVRQNEIKDPALRARYARDPALRDRSKRLLSGIDYTNRYFIYSRESGKLTPAQLSEMEFPNASIIDYLYGPGQPIKFRRDTYHLARDYLKEGRIFTESEKTALCQ